MSSVLKCHNITFSQQTFALPEQKFVEPDNDLVEQDVVPDIEEKEKLETEALKLSSSITQNAQQEAEVIKYQAREEARQEARLIKNQAYAKGYEEGCHLKLAELQQWTTEVENLGLELKSSIEKQLQDYENNLQYLAIEIAKKVIGQVIVENDAAMLNLIKQAIGSIKKSEWIAVTVSDQLSKHLEFITKEVEMIAVANEIKVNAKSLPKGTCLIETESGTIDASIEAQFANLKSLFQQIDPLWRA